jgi:N12 class adenine-specific DNA methylase
VTGPAHVPIDLHGRYLALADVLRARGHAALLDHPEAPRILLDLLRDLTCGVGQVAQVEEPLPQGTDYHLWPEGKRRKYNLDALRVLRRMDCEGRLTPTQEERLYLQAFSGWGGLDLLDFPLDPKVFPPTYLRALEEWQGARRGERPPPATNLWQGVLQQYFTPVPVAEALRGLVDRWAIVAPQTALEPSGGIGRLAEGLGAHWTLVEQDPLLAAMLRALYGSTGAVIEAPFEAYAAEAVNDPSQRFDVCLQNPPYPKRPSSLQAIDPGPKTLIQDTGRIDASPWRMARTYTVARAWDLLRPGGLMVTFVPAGQLQGRDADNIRLRRKLLNEGHLLAGFLPPADLFKKLNSLPASGLVITIWIKTVPGMRERLGWSDRDRAILEGTYFEATEDGRVNLGGDKWVEMTRYAGRRQQEAEAKGEEFVPKYVRGGPFSVEEVVNAQGVALPAWAVTEIREAHAEAIALGNSVNDGKSRPGTLAARSTPHRPPTGTMIALAGDADAGSDTERLQAARAMSLRVLRFLDTVRRDAAVAEAGRAELRDDVLEHTERWGNPHGDPVLAEDREALSGLFQAVAPDGSLPSWLVSGVAARSREEEGPTERSIADVVRWFSVRQGWCGERELVRFDLPTDPVRVLEADDTICIEVRADVGNTYVRKTEYLMGDLNARLDALTAALDAGQEGTVRNRMEQQRVWLLEAIGRMSIAEIEITPRSGFVPVELLSEYVNDTLGEIASDMGSRYYRAEKVDQQVKCVINSARISLTDAEEGRGRWRHLISSPAPREDNPAKGTVGNPAYNWVLNFLGYWNRELQVIDPRGEAKHTDRFPSRIKDPEDRLDEDRKLEQHFSAWVSAHPVWGPQMENEYNRSYRGTAALTYPKDPVAIARASEAIRLRDHQNEAIRRIGDRMSGIMAHDVGAGKTLLGAGSVAFLRQIRKAKRPVIVVPNNVLANWYREVRLLLPDYRIGLIGQTWDPKRRNVDPVTGAITYGGLRDDTGRDGERLAKWQRFKNGGYDVLIVAYSKFLLDCSLSDDSTYEILSELVWLQREAGADAEERELLRRRIEEGRKKLASSAMGQKAREDLEKNIERWEDQLKGPSDSELERMRQEIEHLTTEKPYRPRRKVNGVSVPASHLVSWDELGVDYLLVDEAHNFKNLFGLVSRVGEAKVSYMGDIGDKKVIQTWDMFLKCQDILRKNGDKGVVLLTATPIKNSPLEVYNLLSLVSRNVWRTRKITSAQEFADRYLILETEITPEASGNIGENLAVVGFKNLDELRAIFALYIDRRTTAYLLQTGALRSVPQAPTHRVMLPPDEEQLRLMTDLRTVIAEIREALKEDGGEMARKQMGALGLFQIDMLGKVAVDPRLLVTDYLEMAYDSALATWKAAGKAAMKAAPPLEIQDVLRPGFYDAATDTWKFPKGWKPFVAKTDAQAANRDLKLQILGELDLMRTARYYDPNGDGAIPPKYRALAHNIAPAASCGHIVFTDFNECGEWTRTATAQITGIPLERIVLMTADEWGPDERQQVVDDFNGADAEVDPETGNVITEAREPRYDVIIGNSRTMAEGLNLQRRTCAIHHLDLSWEPATLQQRNGRGVRQGNTKSQVDVYYYLTDKSFDGFRLDAVLGKVGWQDNLYDANSGREINNPAKDAAESREELIIEITAVDIEEARQRLQTVREKREAKRREKWLITARQALGAIVSKFTEARAYDARGEKALADLARKGARMRAERSATDRKILTAMPLFPEAARMAEMAPVMVASNLVPVPVIGQVSQGLSADEGVLNAAAAGMVLQRGQRLTLFTGLREGRLGPVRPLQQQTSVEIVGVSASGVLQWRTWGQIRVDLGSPVEMVRRWLKDFGASVGGAYAAVLGPEQWSPAQDQAEMRGQVGDYHELLKLNPEVRRALNPQAWVAGVLSRLNDPWNPASRAFGGYWTMLDRGGDILLVRGLELPAVTRSHLLKDRVWTLMVPQVEPYAWYTNRVDPTWEAFVKHMGEGRVTVANRAPEGWAEVPLTMDMVGVTSESEAPRGATSTLGLAYTLFLMFGRTGIPTEVMAAYRKARRALDRLPPEDESKSIRTGERRVVR